ncbi:MAG: nucleoside-diphosphate sugar epimerase/dehydratase [Chitinophagaceae bacterium]
MDLFICAFAVILADLLRFDFDYTKPVFQDYSLVYHVIIVTGTNALLFYLLHTYEGIIRFSGLAEALRTIGALFSSFFILLLLNAVVSGLNMHNPIPSSVLFVTFFIASFLIVGYRLLVKGLYRKSLSSGEGINVVIYGGELNGMQLKNTIEQISNFTYRVVAFIDDDPNFIGKSIDNVKIYSYEQMKHVLKRWNIGMMLFAKQEMEATEKSNIVDYCLTHDIHVRNIPPVDEWIKGHLSISQLKEIRIEELLGRPQINLKNNQVENLLKSKRILITGAAGSIGSEIARQVASINPSLVILCDQNETGLHDLEYELKNAPRKCNDMAVYIGDIRDEHSMETLFAKFRPNIIFHAAAYKHVPIMEFHPSEAIRNNVMGTKVLADLSIEYGVERFLFISTDKAINPTNVMGASKRLAEIYVQSLGNRSKKVVHFKANNHDLVNGNGQANTHGATKFITTRFGNVLGSNGSVIPRFKDQIQNGGPVTVTHPDIHRFFMTIPEACNLVLEAVTMGGGSEIFIFDMGEPVKIIDLARKMIRLSGLIPGKDIDIRFTGLRPGEKLYEELLNKSELVIPTHHHKIMIAKVMEYDFYEINKAIDELIQKALFNQDEEVVRKMKRILPEFISNNSIYQSFDEINPDSALSQLAN